VNCNVGKVDRAVRGLSGVVLISFALIFIPTTLPKVIVLAIAVSLILSAWLGVCMLYRLFSLSTVRSPSPQLHSETPLH
jgi:hypothetical protein